MQMAYYLVFCIQIFTLLTFSDMMLYMLYLAVFMNFLILYFDIEIVVSSQSNYFQIQNYLPSTISFFPAPVITLILLQNFVIWYSWLVLVVIYCIYMQEKTTDMVILILPQPIHCITNLSFFLPFSFHQFFFSQICKIITLPRCFNINVLS